MSSSTRCAACKYLRKRCPSDCIFSPYFPSNDPKRFEYVHRIYGASIVARMLQRIPVHLRDDAADTLYYEAHCRIVDPVYGCVRIIHHLQEQLQVAQNQLVRTQAELAFIHTAYGSSTSALLSDQDFSEEVYFSGCENSFSEPNNDELSTFDPTSTGEVHGLT